MEPAELLEALSELARELGLRVESAPSQAALDGGTPGSSAVCVLRGETVVFLAPGDPIEARIALLARALREAFADDLEQRFLPPALRNCIDADA